MNISRDCDINDGIGGPRPAWLIMWVLALGAWIGYLFVRLFHYLDYLISQTPEASEPNYGNDGTAPPLPKRTIRS
jgi:hypothetical protein